MSRASSVPTRAYVSPKRQEQAATRRAIVGAAKRLFLEDGYGPTSIRAIAQEAGVAVQTVYAASGKKRQLLIELIEDAVTGDEDTMVTARSEALAIRAEPSPRRRAEMNAALSRAIVERVLPIWTITMNAAAIDPEFVEVNQAMVARRWAEMPGAAALLAGEEGRLRVSTEDAAASIFVLYSPGVAQTLTEYLGWSFDRYEKWLADAIERLELEDL